MREIESHFGPDSVFLDKEGIHAGDVWDQRIIGELERSCVVLALIGAQWLSARGHHERRRIDEDNDWVRRELVYAHRQGKVIVPALLPGQQMPPLDALPDDLKFLAARQAISLDPTSRSNYPSELMKVLEQNGFVQLPKIEFARPPVDRSRYTLADEEQIVEFTRSNPAWSVRRDDAEVGLERAYTFESFSDAVRFISAAAWDIAIKRHYPEWQHLYQTVRVYYSTWDLGRRISDYDIMMARRLDELYMLYRR